MLGNRVSLLPFSVYCGGVAALSQEHGAGRSAAMSSAAHAKFAGDHSAKRKLAMLSDKEREVVDSWQSPATVHYCEGVTLDYASAEKEVELGLDEYGNHVSPEDEACISVGHMDFGWVREVDGLKVAFVGDIKRTAWTTSDGPDSLQLHGYGFAFASKHNCQAYCTGLWIAEEGEWQWSRDMVVPSSERGVDLWERLYYAITNTSGEYSTGAHCRGCYSRLHCPEYSLPLARSLEGQSLLGRPLDSLSGPELGDLVLRIQSVEDMADKLKKEIQEGVRRGALSAEANGKRYLPVMMPGRKKLDLDKLRGALPNLDDFYTKGEPYDQFRWSKAR